MYLGILSDGAKQMQYLGKGKMEEWKALMHLSFTQKVKYYSHLIKINVHIYGRKIKTLAKNIWKLLQKYPQWDFANLSPAKPLLELCVHIMMIN